MLCKFEAQGELATDDTIEDYLAVVDMVVLEEVKFADPNRGLADEFDLVL